jgi:hypothetical protein
MALPKIDAPVYELELPLSKNRIRFRPFLVKEQRNLMMAMESEDKETIEKNIKQVLHNCILTENIDVDALPLIDVEFLFINLRARSVGEIVESKYRCENLIETLTGEKDTTCNNLMDVNINLLDIKVNINDEITDVIQLTPQISIKMKYPEFSILESVSKLESSTDIAFDMIISSVESIFDGQQYFYAKEVTRQEIVDFIESLNQDQFSKIENFFNNLPSLNKNVNMTCGKCGFDHTIEVEGLDNFFG